MGVLEITEEAQFNRELEGAQGLVVVDFFATWCGPCQQVAPKVTELSNLYPSVVFLKLDVDKFPDIAQSQGVSAMPTFNFYLRSNKVDSVRGADPVQLENKIKQWVDKVGDKVGDSKVPGQMDLSVFIDKGSIECLNENDTKTFRQMLHRSGELESDCDEQLIMTFSFNQPVKLHSLVIKAPEDSGPKKMKMFTNLTSGLDFDKAASLKAIQELELTKSQISLAEPISLRFVNFQNVQSVQIFVETNQDGTDTTKILGMDFFGTPISKTNMAEFKRVSGKKGERED